MKNQKDENSLGGLSWVRLDLTKEEERILRGKRGKMLQKVMKTVVHYAQACGAKKLVPIDGAAHMVISQAFPGLGPRMEMVEELVRAGLRTKWPFTVDPRPLDFENLALSSRQKRIFQDWYGNQDCYEKRLKRLGLRNESAFTCTCYLPEVGNIPRKGEVLAWSESSAVIFANSVLGARTNRNGAIMDLLCNLSGRAPYFGLLTDEGRRAGWLVEVRTSTLPDPQLLGGAIGKKVQTDVPYIAGLDKFLGRGLNRKTRDFLKDMGACCAALGACGLFHVENITPEAVKQKWDLLKKDSGRYVIDDQELRKTRKTYSVLWKNKRAKPKRCLIGCPHLSLEQLNWWVMKIHEALRGRGKPKPDIEVALFAAPEVLEEFRKNQRVFGQSIASGIKLSPICIESFMNNPLVAEEPIITNSNKLRAYTTARFFLDQEILDIIADRRSKKAGRA